MLSVLPPLFACEHRATCPVLDAIPLVPEVFTMSRRHPSSRRPLYPPIMLRPVPFALPAHFLRQLGYDRAMTAPDRIAAAVLRATLRWPQAAVSGLLPVYAAHQPRRFVALWEHSAAGELGWTDGLHAGVGHLDRQVWLAWLHAGRPLGLVAAWLLEHEVCLGAGARRTELGPSHWLLVDRNRNRAWVVTHGLGRAIVRMQRFHTSADAVL